MRFIAMSKFIHEREDFKTLIEVVGGEHKIDPRLIEKDGYSEFFVGSPARTN
nr:hypothetical protein HAGR004_15830 [Bdellovibrio sp. HAGR004]